MDIQVKEVIAATFLLYTAVIFILGYCWASYDFHRQKSNIKK